MPDNPTEEVVWILTTFLQQSTDLALFVRSGDNQEAILGILKTRIEALGSARIVVLLSFGSAAKTLGAILSKIFQDKRGYVVERNGSPWKLIAFVFTPEV